MTKVKNFFEIIEYKKYDLTIWVAIARGEVTKEILLDLAGFHAWMKEDKRLVWEMKLQGGNNITGELTDEEYWQEMNPLQVQYDLYDFICEKRLPLGPLFDDIFSQIN